MSKTLPTLSSGCGGVAGPGPPGRDWGRVPGSPRAEQLPEKRLFYVSSVYALVVSTEVANLVRKLS